MARKLISTPTVCLLLLSSLSSARAQRGDPVIRSFTPGEGASGTVITVRGENFEADGNNVSLVLRAGDGSIPILVTEASDTLLRGSIGRTDLTGAAKSASIVYSSGRGTVAMFAPGFADVTVEAPVWVWSRDSTDGPQAVSTDLFLVDPTTLPAGTECFSSGSPVAGELCVFLDGNWADGATVELSVRMHNQRLGLGYGLHAPSVRLAAGGSTLECARRICDAVVRAFASLASVEVSCGVEELRDGRVKLALGLPVAGAVVPIEWGDFTVCVTSAAAAPGIRIDSIAPARGGPGTEVTIFGSGFGADANDLCVGMKTAGVTMLFEVLRLEDVDGDLDPELIVRVPPLPTERLTGVCGTEPILHKPCPMTVWRGAGVLLGPDQLDPASFDAAFGQPVRVWARDPGGAQATAVFLPVPDPEAMVDEECFLSSPVLERKVTARVNSWDDAVPNIQDFVFDLRLKLLDNQAGTGFALHVPAVSVGGPGGFPPDVLCETIRRGMAAAGVDVECRYSRVDSSIEVSDPTGGGWDDGSLEVCYSPRMARMPMIADIAPKAGDMTTRIVIDGCGFPSDPADVCAAIQPLDGRPPIPLRIVEASPTRLVATPTSRPSQPGEFTGRIVVNLGRGVVGDVATQAPSWSPEGSVRVWEMRQSSQTEAVSEADYTLTVAEMPGVTVVTSDPPSAGLLEMGMANLCSGSCRVGLELILFDDVERVGYCLSAVGTRRGDALGEDLCEVISRSFSQLLDVEVGCEVADDPTGRRVIRLALPGGRITRGVLALSLEDVSSAPVITDFGPSRVGPGDIVTIHGSGFGDDPAAISVAAVFEPNGIPFDVIEITDTEIEARAGEIDPVLGKPVCLHVYRGVGFIGTAKPTPKPVQGDLFRTWERRGGALAVSPKPILPTGFTKPVDLFAPVALQGAGGQIEIGDADDELLGCVFGDVEDGRLCVDVRGDWPPDLELRVTFRAHNSTLQLGTELEAFRVTTPGGSAAECAQSLADLIRWRLMQLLDTDVEIEVIENADGSVKLAAALLGGVAVEWGIFDLCLLAPSGGAVGGDCNGDGELDVSDAVCLLGFLFGTLGVDDLPCGDRIEPEPDPADVVLLDWDGSGTAPDLADVVGLLTHVFVGGPPHPLGPGCVSIPGCPGVCAP